MFGGTESCEDQKQSQKSLEMVGEIIVGKT